MPANAAATAYADRVCARLPVVLARLCAQAGISQYEFERRSGVSREMIRRVRRGQSSPTMHVSAKLAHGAGATLARLVQEIEKEA